MTAITVQDLDNAKIDVDLIAEVANSEQHTTVDRLGHTKLTVTGAMARLVSINFRGPWTTATAYAVKDSFSEDGIVYVTVVAHTSTTVSADLAAGKIALYQGVVTTSTDHFYAPADFTPGSTDTLILSRAPGSTENATVFFGAAYQAPTGFIVTGSSLQFNDPIPDGVTEVHVQIGRLQSSVVPSSGSVGDDALAWGNSLERYVDTVAALKDLPSATYRRAITLRYGDTTGSGGYWMDPTDHSTPENGGSVLVANDAARWKLIFEDILFARQFGVRADNTGDESSAINAAILAMYEAGGGTVKLPSGNIRLTNVILLYPNVELSGQGKGKTYLQWQGSASSTMIRTVTPTPGVLAIGGGVNNLTLNGQSKANGITGVDLSDASGWNVHHIEFANLIYGLHFNKYAAANGSAFNGQAYFNRVSQCEFVLCGSDIAFGGATNRNTFDTNTHRDADVAYDFGISGNFSETNVFINENVEGCHAWAEWSAILANIYSQTWIGLTVENPTSNGYVCTMKDPGRQNFIGLTIIPANNPSAVDFYNIFTDGGGKAIRSDVFGTQGSSGAYAGYGNRSIEDMHMLGGAIRTRMYGSAPIPSQTIAAGNYITIGITVPGAVVGDTLAWSIDQHYPTLQKDVALTAANSATLTLYNQTGSGVAVNANVYVSVAGRATNL